MGAGIWCCRDPLVTNGVIRSTSRNRTCDSGRNMSNREKYAASEEEGGTVLHQTSSVSLRHSPEIAYSSCLLAVSEFLLGMLQFLWCRSLEVGFLSCLCRITIQVPPGSLSSYLYQFRLYRTHCWHKKPRAYSKLERGAVQCLVRAMQAMQWR